MHNTVTSSNSGFLHQPQNVHYYKRIHYYKRENAKIDNRSTKHIHYNERFHYNKIHYYQRRLYIHKVYDYMKTNSNSFIMYFRSLNT